jgi:hypothetical protein
MSETTLFGIVIIAISVRAIVIVTAVFLSGAREDRRISVARTLSHGRRSFDGGRSSGEEDARRTAKEPRDASLTCRSRRGKIAPSSKTGGVRCLRAGSDSSPLLASSSSS